MFRKINAFILAAMLLCMLCPAMQAGAYTTYFEENFENFNVSNWYTASSLVGEETGNHYGIVNSTDSANRMLLQESAGYPGNEFFLSVDFMIPEGGSNKAMVLGSTYRAGKGEGCHVWYENGSLTLGYSSQPIEGATVVATNLETGRWYNIFAYLNHADTSLTPKFTVYFGTEQTAETEFVTKITGPASQGCGFLGRWIQLREMDGKDVYFDNIRVIPKADYELELALLRARSIAMNAEIGYEDGMYPESAASTLLSAYQQVNVIAQSNSMNDTEKEEALSEISEALTVFENAKIDSSSTSSELCYIRVNESGNMLTAGSTTPGNSFVMPLEAKGYTNAGVETEDEVIWTVEPQNEHISIADGNLVVGHGFEGGITLTATAGEISMTHRVNVVSIRDITISSIGGKDNAITVSGKFTAPVSEPVTITVTGDGLSLSGTVTIDEDSAFTWTSPVPETTVCQYFQVEISGLETVTKQAEGYYYGVGWETDVLSDVNQAGNDLARILGIHREALQLDGEVLALYPAEYAARMAAKVPFGDLRDIGTTALETEFVLSQANVTRDGIEALTLKYMTLLSNNGFDVASLSPLSAEQKRTFYLNAAAITVSVQTATVASIATQYQSILNNLLNTNNNNSVIIPGGSFVSGGGGGAVSGGGGGGGYPVTLVGGKNDKTDTREKEDTTQTPEISDFQDVSKDFWGYSALMYLKEKGIMTGNDNRVRPEDSVTRGEFAKIIVTAFELQEMDSEINFTDSADAWWEAYAQTAAAHGIVNGMGDGRFGGDEVITREMLAVMIDRAIAAKQIELYDQNNGADFADSEYMSDYAKDAIYRLGQKGIVSGIGNGVFAPGLSVTRAQAAQIVYNVLKQL